MKKRRYPYFRFLILPAFFILASCWSGFGNRSSSVSDDAEENLPEPAEYQEVILPSPRASSSGTQQNVPEQISPSEYPRSETFSFRLTEEPETLDWNRAHTVVETHLLLNIMEGLVELSPNLKVQPALAESWVIENQGQRYQFKLRKNLRWSDGVTLKAGDFVSSWRRLLSAGTASPYAYLLFDIRNAQEYFQGKISDFSQVGINAPDEHTLVVDLVRPIQYWLQLLTFWPTFPMREDLIKKHGSAWTHPGNLVTLGPYKLAQLDAGQRVVLEAHTDYWRKRGNIKRVIGKIIKDDKTAIQAFADGSVDFVDQVNSILASQLPAGSDLRRFPYLKTAYLGFNTRVTPTDNVHFRRAISHAIDRRLFSKVLQAGQEAAQSFVPPPLLGHSDRIGLAFDLQLAKSELKKVGLRQTLSIEMELLIPTWDKDRQIAQSIAEQLKKNLNLNINVQAFEYKTFRTQLDLQKFSLFQGLWGADFPDADNFLSIFLTDSGINKTGWSSPDFDRQIIAARSLNSSSARAKAYDRMQRLVQEEVVAFLPLYYEPITALVSKRLKGFSINPLNYVYLRDVNLSGR